MALCLLLATACTTQQLNKTLGDLGKVLDTNTKPTEGEVISGLREALVKGAGVSTLQASKLDGYYKNPQLRIPFPPEVQRVEKTLRDLGMNRLVDDFILTLNRGAEEAAKSAKPIFVSAIQQMTIRDAWNILSGSSNEATEYLRRTTSGQLTSAFQPVIRRSLNKTKATKYYSDIVTNYNRIPGVQDVNPNLDQYATQKAIDGLFVLIAKEEANIRANPVARTTELLEKVFGYAAENKG